MLFLTISHLSYQQERSANDKKWYYFNIATDPTKATGLVADSWNTLVKTHKWKAQGVTLNCPCR